MSTILVVAAHPDDEVLGCGGTIAKHIKNGDEVHVLILAEGITSRNTKNSFLVNEEIVKELHDCAKIANDILGVNSLEIFNYPDNRMDSVDLLDVVKTIEKKLFEVTPEIVYTHHIGDLNIDHQITHRGVITACRPVINQCVKKIYCFEVPSSTNWETKTKIFSPQLFVDVHETLFIKLNALNAYQTEMRPWPHTRSIKAVEHLMRWRGSSVGLEAAETFEIIRDVLI